MVQLVGAAEFQSMTSENGVHLEIIWFDQDVIEIVLSCSNGRFSGQEEIYLSHDDLLELADGLRGFPQTVSDSRNFELGAFNPSHADGGSQDEVQLSGFHGTRGR